MWCWERYCLWASWHLLLQEHNRYLLLLEHHFGYCFLGRQQELKSIILPVSVASSSWWNAIQHLAVYKITSHSLLDRSWVSRCVSVFRTSQVLREQSNTWGREQGGIVMGGMQFSLASWTEALQTWPYGQSAGATVYDPGFLSFSFWLLNLTFFYQEWWHYLVICTMV